MLTSFHSYITLRKRLIDGLRFNKKYHSLEVSVGKLIPKYTLFWITRYQKNDFLWPNLGSTLLLKIMKDKMKNYI